MKKRLLFLSVLALFLSATSWAYDFSAVNEDGVTIYYDKSGSNATVAYRTASGGSYAGTVVIPETVEYNGITYSVTAIGGWAFTGCTGLTEVTIPNSVTEIGEYAFNKCTGLSSITIPQSVVLIGNAAFADCSNISTVTIEDGIETLAFVGSIETFYQCSIKTAYQGRNTSYENHPPFWSSATLTSLTLGDNVTSIGDNEFECCLALTSMTIPASVMEIGDMAFNMCVNMTL